MSTKISIIDAASLLNISVQHTRTLCRDQELKAEKISNAWIIDRNSVTNYGLRTAHMIAEDHAVYRVESRNKNQPIALSFFSGAMGLDLGLEKAGFDIRLACEFNKYCRQTIALNRPNTALLSDINDYSAEQVLQAAQVSAHEVDLIVGGPPCQAFSTAGKRKAFNDDRGNAFLKYIDLALTIRPRLIVIENVRGLLSCPMDHRPHDQRGPEFPDLSQDEMKGGALNFVLSKLQLAGYTCSFNLYSAANFGTPQIRERVIIICSRDGVQAPFLTPTHSENGELGLPRWKTFREAVQGIEHHEHLNFPEKRLKYYRLLSSGQNWRNLTPELQREALGKSLLLWRRQDWFPAPLELGQACPNPGNPPCDASYRPSSPRRRSTTIHSRVQTPARVSGQLATAGPLIEQYKQVGNAVPVSLGYAVGRLVRDLLQDKASPAPRNFKFSRYQATTHNEWMQLFKQQADKALGRHPELI